MSAQPLFDCAETFSSELFRIACEDSRICVVINDSAETHHALSFQKRFPERMVDVGIAEQNMVGVASGLANSGRVPWIHSATCFLTARAMEQIKVDIAYSGANAKICGFVSGLAYGALGGTHHSIEDIAWMRAIPNLRVIAPASPNDTAAMVRAAAHFDGPVFLRIISKTKIPELFPDTHEFKFGHAALLKTGQDVALIGTGLTSSRLFEAAGLLSKSGIDATVIHMGSIVPIDRAAIANAARTTNRIVVAEDHVSNGGLFGAVAEIVVQEHPVPILPIGVNNEFAPIGPPDFLHERYGLTAQRMASRIKNWIERDSDSSINSLMQ